MSMVSPSSLQLTFTSDFSQFGSSGAGPQIWDTTLPHGLRTITGTGEKEYYSDSSVGTNPFTLDGNGLDITASTAANPAGLPYTSGVITTESSFSQLYGYFQMTAELPAGQGMWPAFWLLPENLSGTQEIDAMEEFGRNPDQYSVSAHSPSSGIASATLPTANLTQGFHTYGVYWTPTTISYYLDGIEVAVTPTPPDLDTPMFMLANLAVSSDVAPSTTFPATLKIASISAYAYNPSVPGPPAPLVTVVPTASEVALDTAAAIHGVEINDPDIDPSSVISVSISDKSLGILSVAPVAGVTVSGNNGWSVDVSGTLSAVNETLATLTYKNVPTTSTAPTSDTITIASSDVNGNFDSSRTGITLTPGSPMQFVNIGPEPTRVLANGSDVFVLTAGQIADSQQNDGQADHIVNFHEATQAGASGDFIALHGFDASAQLVFDHLADVNGVANGSMQYYRVDSDVGSSPTFLVQMAGNSTAHLGSGDFGIYPS
jgi:beta-glucanase (GH16 family)